MTVIYERRFGGEVIINPAQVLYIDQIQCADGETFVEVTYLGIDNHVQLADPGGKTFAYLAAAVLRFAEGGRR